MERLAGAKELLDGPLDDHATLEGNLRDLRRINRLGGGTRLSRRALDALLRTSGPDATTRSLRLLDVGTGAADIPLTLLRTSRSQGPRLEILCLDSRREVLDAALALEPGLRTATGLTLQVGDGRALPYQDAAFDVAHASLVLHHLDPDDAASLLGEMRRVSRLGVIINDLARGRIHWLLGWLVLHAVTRNRFTRHDGPLSVRRAYTSDEARGLIERAGLRVVHVEHGIVRHRWAIAAVAQ